MRATIVSMTLFAALLSAGCKGNAKPTDMGSSADMAQNGADGGTMTPDLGCYGNPQTHQEIINSCTTATPVDKVPVTPLLNPDGTLPPLP